MSRLLRRSAVLVPALLALPLLAGTGPAGATEPAPAPGVAAAITAGGVGGQVFYQRADRRLAMKTLAEDGTVVATTDLGGVVTSAPAAAYLGDVSTSRLWVFARGADGAVHYRRLAGGWSAWTSLGGRTDHAPAVGCGLPEYGPRIWVTGTDGRLWTRHVLDPFGLGWQPYGGGAVLGAPAVMQTADLAAPSCLDWVAGGLGTDRAAWLLDAAGTWSRVGGLSDHPPAYLRLTGAPSPNHVFLVGTDGALWTASRPDDRATWSKFTRIGGSFVSAPAAQLLPNPPATLSVVGQGTNGRLYRAYRAVGGTGPWTFVQLP